MTEVITVKVIRVPGEVKEVGLVAGATVADALTQAGVTGVEGETVMVGGATADLSTTLTDGARVVLARGAKGNS